MTAGGDGKENVLKSNDFSTFSSYGGSYFVLTFLQH